MSYTLTELNATIDEKLTRLGKAIDMNILQNFIVFGIFTLPLLAPGTFSLPKIYGVSPEQYQFIIPLVLVILFVRFGFITLRFLRLIVERDKTILTIVASMKDKTAHLKRLKNVYRQSSLGEVYYKTLVFPGINYLDYIEEPTKSYRAFTYFWISIIVANTLLTVIYLYQYIHGKLWYFSILLFLGILIIIFSYVDYFIKIKRIKQDMQNFYLKWLDENIEKME